jgi:hypothetical protein
MDIQHYIITKKEEDLRFLENKKRKRKMLPFFVRIKKETFCKIPKCLLCRIIIDPLKYMHELLH